MAQSDRDKYISLEEQLKAYQEKLQEKIDKRKEEERKLKVTNDATGGSSLGVGPKI